MLLSYDCGPDGRSAELRTKFFRISMLALLAGLAMYSVAGYLVAPRIIKYWIENFVTTGPGGHRLAVEHVQVNPFTLFISLTNVTLIGRENKLVVSIGQVETSLRILERLRTTQPGFDVAIRGLRVTDPPTAKVILTVPDLSVTRLVVDAAQGGVALGAARLANPEFNVTRDAAGELHPRAWLRLPSKGSPPAPIVFDKLEVIDGTLRFTDQALSPALRLDADGIVGTVTRGRKAGNDSMAVEFEGRFGASGSGEVIAEWRASRQHSPTTVNLAMHRIDLAAMSPYFVQIAQRRIAAGTGNVTLHFEDLETSARVDGRIDVDRLQLVDKVATDASDTTALDFAAALTTDNTGRIDLSIPILKSGSDVDPAAAIVDSLNDYINALAATPFEVLQGIAGREEEDLGTLAFPPGSAEITPAAAEKIASLARALDQRPLLALRAYPAYDPVADRDAIAAQQVHLHIKLATSADSSGLSNQKSLDFADPKVRMILDEFAGARLPESRRLAILRRFRGKDDAYYQAVHDALVANEDVSETVLRRLAHFRARSVVGALAKGRGDEKQLLLADTIETNASAGNAVVVRLEALPRQ